MSIKIFINIFLLLLGLFFLSGCAKQENKKNSAETSYKMALLALDEYPQNEQAIKTAISYLDSAIAQENRVDFIALKASLFFKLRQYEEAKNIFEKLLNKNMQPKLRCEVLNNYACLLSQIGEGDKGLEIWKHLENNKDYFTPEVALVNEGRFFIISKEFVKAKEAFLKAIEIAPNYLDAHFYLAYLSKEFLKNYALAKKEADIVLFLEPKHLGAIDLKKRLNKRQA
ncbi:TPA: hypothetical protein DEO28_03835 [Candidatus Dependentiae bacterium]|nr:MAG: hypothetical protein UR14_C0006G0006 [candidate division TM6 bacterium GW2011_GWE2_31_21]KKP53571.1 MAG: hypothetical protein UR43_C0004G0112 [candidate division TM6 bacterium GW2011_GWF2_33_332]HBS48188.1 hypothetical protein [Candidatus Dependentiae bacterium]HBZ73613.1 hypothetical protein [Candidatus Dependentiae bacterium]